MILNTITNKILIHLIYFNYYQNFKILTLNNKLVSIYYYIYNIFNLKF